MTEPKTHRLHVIVEEPLWLEWNKAIQWGLRQHLICAIMKLIIGAVQRDGMMVVGAILSGEYKLVRDDRRSNSSGEQGSGIEPSVGEAAATE